MVITFLGKITPISGAVYKLHHVLSFEVVVSCELRKIYSPPKAKFESAMYSIQRLVIFLQPVHGAAAPRPELLVNITVYLCNNGIRFILKDKTVAI